MNGAQESEIAAALGVDTADLGQVIAELKDLEETEATRRSAA